MLHYAENPFVNPHSYDINNLFTSFLGAAGYYLDPVRIYRLIINFECRVLQDERPHFVTRSIYIQISLSLENTFLSHSYFERKSTLYIIGEFVSNRFVKLNESVSHMFVRGLRGFTLARTLRASWGSTCCELTSSSRASVRAIPMDVRR